MLTLKQVETYNAWIKIFDERYETEQKFSIKWNRACSALMWYIDKWFTETDENKKKELSAICDKVADIRVALWDKKQYWQVRADDAFTFAQNTLKETR